VTKTNPVAVLKSSRPTTLSLLALGLAVLWQRPAMALEPPTPEQLKKYVAEKRLEELSKKAVLIGNHKAAPGIVRQLKTRIQSVLKPTHQGAQMPPPMPPSPENAPMPEAWTMMPASGSPKVLALLIAFKDYPATVPATTVNSMLFGDGNAANFPRESLRKYYQRSSYNQLNITGNVLGWYTTSYNRSAVVETATGRENLIKEALNHYNAAGHDFSQYDNNGDGKIDYLIVMWAGPVGDWATFWWGYKTGWTDSSYTLDGKKLSTYSWQWQSSTPATVIHETGHALGLPDLYHYYNSTVGPKGGVGGLDMMDGVIGDHNCFSKFLLGWLTPNLVHWGQLTETLRSASLNQDCSLVAPSCNQDVCDDDAFSEFYLVENRTRKNTGNDKNMPGDGLMIWHIDGRLDSSGNYFQYNNSDTAHKLVRLMEADGLEEIESGGSGNAGDYWASPKSFSSTSTPVCSYYDGAKCQFNVGDISAAGDPMKSTFTFSTKGQFWCFTQKLRNLTLICAVLGCEKLKKPWEDVVNPAERWIEENRKAGSPNARKLADITKQANALVLAAGKATPTKAAAIDAKAKQLLTQMQKMGLKVDTPAERTVTTPAKNVVR